MPPGDYLAGEEFLCERGTSELLQHWLLRDAPAAPGGYLASHEVSPHGTMVADALLAEALVSGGKPRWGGRILRSG